MTNVAVVYPHLTMAEDGCVRIGNSRYKAIHLAAEHYHHGWSAEELLRQHPDLRPEEVYAVLTWFYDQFDEIVQEIQAKAVDAESRRQAGNVSREELLGRVGAVKR